MQHPALLTAQCEFEPDKKQTLLYWGKNIFPAFILDYSKFLSKVMEKVNAQIK